MKKLLVIILLFCFDSFAFANNDVCSLFDQNQDEVVVYPNPFKNELNIKVPEGSYVIISNLIGEKIFEVEKTNRPITNIDLGNIPNGIYFIKVKIEDDFTTKRIIKE